MTEILAGEALLHKFVETYQSGAQGCEMDCDAAQALAEAIDAMLRMQAPAVLNSISHNLHLLIGMLEEVAPIDREGDRVLRIILRQ